MPPFFVRYRKKGEKKNRLWGPRYPLPLLLPLSLLPFRISFPITPQTPLFPATQHHTNHLSLRFDHIETEDGRIYFDQGRETGPLQTRYRERSEERFAEKKWEEETLERLREERRMQREAMRMGMGGDPGPGPGPGRGGGHGGGHGGPLGGPPGGGEGGGEGGGPDEMRGPGAGHGGDHGGGRGGMGGSGEVPGGRGGGFVGRGVDLGGIPINKKKPGGPEIQRGHGPGGGEPSIDGEELRPPEAGHGDAHHDHAPSETTDDESSASSHDDEEEEAAPMQANGEFNPRHQFNVPPADNNPHGPAARRVPHGNGASRGTPEGWNPNTGGVAARTAFRGSGLYAVRPKKKKKKESSFGWFDVLAPGRKLGGDWQEKGKLVRVVRPGGGKESEREKKGKKLEYRKLSRDEQGRLVRGSWLR